VIVMNKLLFGTAGIPICTSPRNTTNGIKQVRGLGLDSMELEFVRSVNLSTALAEEVRKTATKENVKLTCHGQYFVNLNSMDAAKRRASVERILSACRICHIAGVWSVCYHFAYYHHQDKSLVLLNVKKEIEKILLTLREEGIQLWLRPETGGRVTQFGDLNELISLSESFEEILPCIDFAHHHSRTNGKYNTHEEFLSILSTIERRLGRHALNNMHIHTEGIAYNKKGERHHLNLQESDFNFLDLVQTWKDFNIKGVVTCESPNIEKDALLLQKAYKNLFR